MSSRLWLARQEFRGQHHLHRGAKLTAPKRIFPEQEAPEQGNPRTMGVSPDEGVHQGNSQNYGIDPEGSARTERRMESEEGARTEGRPRPGDLGSTV